MASVGRGVKVGLTTTGHPERKSKFCDNEIPSPAVTRSAFDRLRMTHCRRYSRKIAVGGISSEIKTIPPRPTTITANPYHYPPYGGCFVLRLRRGMYAGLGKRDEGRGDFPKERYNFVSPPPFSLIPNA